MAISKRRKALADVIKQDELLSLDKAVKQVKETATAKFVETVEVAINLGVDARKSDQTVRGATLLPHGTGKQVRVAVFAQGDKAEMAEKAGADIVGLEDLVEKVKKGELNFDVVIATPDTMAVVGKLGQILGPRGLMPNPKVGTVTADVKTAVENAKRGQVRYRTDKNGIIHCAVGKADFNEQHLIENIEALLVDLKKSKPSSAKGTYFKKITLSSTMGVGIAVDRSSITAV